jgi:hypothetical protein
MALKLVKLFSAWGNVDVVEEAAEAFKLKENSIIHEEVVLRKVLAASSAMMLFHIKQKQKEQKDESSD